MEYRLKTKTHLAVPRDKVFAFFAAAENLERLTPPELGFVVRTPLPIAMAPGTLIDYTIKLWGLPMKWRTRIAAWNPPFEFVDEQLKGPYAKWVHTHRFTESDGGTDIDDEVVYKLPFGILGRIVHPLIRLQLGRIFRFREEQVVKLVSAT